MVRLNRKSLSRKSLSAFLCLGVLIFALVPVMAVAGGPDLATYPAYYEGQVITIMMGPSGNSSSPSQSGSCFGAGLGPNVTKGERSAVIPDFYALFVPGANQMPCSGNSSMTHDMVFTRAPGASGYKAVVQGVMCTPGENFADLRMPLKSAGEVEAAIDAGKLNCSPLSVLVSPVVHVH